MQRLLFGAIAGVCATMAMTSGMRLLFRRLPQRHRYPLPPREITEDLVPAPRRALPSLTVLAHFGYGALAGAVFPMLPAFLRNGPLYGVAVWGLSYLGWIPAARVLRPATLHPGQRNLLMIAVHLVWGLALSMNHRELERSARDVFAGGPEPDRQKYPQPGRTGY